MERRSKALILLGKDVGNTLGKVMQIVGGLGDAITRINKVHNNVPLTIDQSPLGTIMRESSLVIREVNIRNNVRLSISSGKAISSKGGDTNVNLNTKASKEK